MIGGLEEARQPSINGSLRPAAPVPLEAEPFFGAALRGRYQDPQRAGATFPSRFAVRCFEGSGPDPRRAVWAQDGGRERWTLFETSRGKWMPLRQANLLLWVRTWGGGERTHTTHNGIASIF